MSISVNGPAAYPLRVDARGGTARTDRKGYLRDLVEQVLFTAPGERVNRPEFGVGVGQLVFDPISPEIAVTTQMLIHGALQQSLGELIDVVGVEVSAVESTLTIEVRYAERLSGEADTMNLTLQAGAS